MSKDKTKYWFVRKQYGWGWTPASWQGWAVLGIYTGALISLFARLGETDSQDQIVSEFILPALGVTVILGIVTMIKGEMPPRWQWGIHKNNERKND